ncbi:MAG: hypothetical protein ACPGJS_20035 [Flammeovirgaceae bacterium]
MLEKFKFRSNEITNWTILPSSITARAWLSDDFKKNLLENPTPILAKYSKKWPKNLSVVVVEDQLDLRHFVLPSQHKSKKLNGTYLLETLNEETKNSKPLEWALPTEVIHKALSDANYKEKLITNAKGVLLDEGHYIAESRVVVFENSEFTHHLVLPRNPFAFEEISIKELNERLMENLRSGSTGTGQCCASGTCS